MATKSLLDKLEDLWEKRWGDAKTSEESHICDEILRHLDSVESLTTKYHNLKKRKR